MVINTKKARLKKLLTQEEAATACGLSRETILKIENGKANNITLHTLEKLCNGLQCEIADILSR